MIYRATNQTQKSVVAEYVEKAIQLRERLKGLLGRTSFPDRHGLWIEPCKSIHTFFMRFPIDVIFLSKEGFVLSMRKRVVPFRMTCIVWRAQAVLELPAQTLENSQTHVGDLIRLEKAT